MVAVKLVPRRKTVVILSRTFARSKAEVEAKLDPAFSNRGIVTILASKDADGVVLINPRFPELVFNLKRSVW